MALCRSKFWRNSTQFDERQLEKATTGLGMMGREGFAEEMKGEMKMLESWRMGEEICRWPKERKFQVKWMVYAKHRGLDEHVLSNTSHLVRPESKTWVAECQKVGSSQTRKHFEYQIKEYKFYHNVF